jgi:hypothetical protein
VIAPRVSAGPSFPTRPQQITHLIGSNQPTASAYVAAGLLSQVAGGDGP